MSQNALGSLFLEFPWLHIPITHQMISAVKSNRLKEIGNVIFIDYGNHFLKTDTFITCDVSMG